MVEFHTLTTVAELDALPILTVIVDARKWAWQKDGLDRGWNSAEQGFGLPAEEIVRRGPALLYGPVPVGQLLNGQSVEVQEYGVKGPYNTPQVNVSLESALYNARENSQPVYARRPAGPWEVATDVHNYETSPDPLVVARVQEWHDSLYNADPNCPKPLEDGRSSGTGCKNCKGWDCY